MRASRGLKWENKMYMLKRSIAKIFIKRVGDSTSHLTTGNDNEFYQDKIIFFRYLSGKSNPSYDVSISTVCF